MLSRKAIKVTLRNLDKKLRSRDSAADDAVSAGPLTQSGAFPFAAIYLPRDAARDMPSTLLVPLVEYIAGGDFELVFEPHAYRIRLGQVIEQRDDWVWVKVQVLEKGTG
ncbi:hypothetical protein GALL_359250 [mine drainage metagenome]|uniref:Uncharacterized protein n=1 Tax=mine drainage metagenome TaxID=410659 RepID=A0A1J5QQT8_9ZZZZ